MHCSEYEVVIGENDGISEERMSNMWKTNETYT